MHSIMYTRPTVLCIFIELVLIACSDDNLFSYIFSFQELNEVYRTLEERDHVLALIKLIDLKFKVDPPEDFSLEKGWLLLARRVLVRIHPIYNRLLKTVDVINAKNNTFLHKHKEESLSTLNKVKNMAATVEKYINKLVDKIDPVGEVEEDDDSEEANDSGAISSIINLFGNVATDILNAANEETEDIYEEELTTESSPVPVPVPVLNINPSYEELEMKIESSLNFLFLKLKLNCYFGFYIKLNFA
ncbi:hypothetical protein FQA39_LY04111 [Lamprigera yunnana]|nr:hypothetical protein FQA39_LY04111 [Lamprigera yunnana]